MTTKTACILIAAAIAVGIACGKSTPTSATPPVAQPPPPAPPVSVTFNLQIVRPGTADNRNGAMLERGELMQRASLRVRGSVEAVNGSATVTNSCAARWGDFTASNIPPFGFTQTVRPGSPFTFDREWDLLLAVLALAADPGTLTCTLEVKDDINRRLADVVREIGFGLAEAAVPPRQCVPDAETLCILDRFEAKVSWRQPDGTTTPGQVRPNGRFRDGGFFVLPGRPGNEIFIRMTDRCAAEAAFWAEISGQVDNSAIFELAIEEMKRSISRKYSKRSGEPFSPIRDTNAFATCP